MQKTQENTALVLFRVGPVLCCAPAQPIQSIVTPPKLTRTPGSTDTRPGIFHHNDNVVQVSDLRIRFGVSEAMRSKPGRMIITQQENGHMAFWVDEITEVIQSPKEGWGKLPPYIPRGIFSHTLLLNNEIHLYVEIEKLDELPEENYLRQYIQRFEPEEPEQPEETAEEKAASTPTDSTSEESTSEMRTSDSATSGSTSDDAEKSSETAKDSTRDVDNTTTASTNLTAATDEKPDREEPAVAESPTYETVSTPTSAESDAPAPETRNESADRPTKTSESVKAQVDDEALTKTEEAPDTQPNGTQSETLTQTSDELLAPTTEDKPEQIGRTESESRSFSEPASPSATTPETDSTESHPESVTEAETQNKTETPVSTTLASTTPATETQATESVTDSDTEETSSAETKSYELRDNHELIPPEKKAELEAQEQRRSKLIRWLASAAVILLAAGMTAYLLLGPDKPTPLTIASNPALDTTAIDEKESYRAEIKHVQEGVVIEIEAPDDVVVLHDPDPDPDEHNTETKQAEDDEAVTEPDKDDTESKTADTEVDTTEADDKTAQLDNEQEDSVKPIETDNDKKDEQDQKSAQSTSEPDTKTASGKTVVREIVHVVVKGDTLWDIALHYVKDPYRYPELAKLSNIKNPDLIYPGNRVRIIHTRKGKK